MLPMVQRPSNLFLHICKVSVHVIFWVLNLVLLCNKPDPLSYFKKDEQQYKTKAKDTILNHNTKDTIRKIQYKTCKCGFIKSTLRIVDIWHMRFCHLILTDNCIRSFSQIQFMLQQLEKGKVNAKAHLLYLTKDLIATCNIWATLQMQLTLKVQVTTIDAQWEGMGDVGLARYEPALLPPCPTIRVLSYSN